MESVLFPAMGVATIVLTAMKPRFFWEHPKALGLRRFAGDGGAAGVYYAIGLLLVAVGIGQALAGG